MAASNPEFVTVTNLAAFTPAETIEIVSRAGVAKGNMRPDKVFFSSISAGCLLSFACALALSTNTAPWYQENAPGLIRTISCLVFPFGFVMITLTGADLFTGTHLYTTVAVLEKRLPVWKMALHWFITFWGNLAGSLFVTLVIVGYGGVFSSSPYSDEAIAFATKKQVVPEWHMIFLRGIGCNWLVCLACLLACQAKDLSSKILAMWWPIAGFVGLGFDHVVANEFFIPLGIFLGTPDLSVGLYIWKGIIPTALGNIVGGVLMVACYYWYMNLFQQAPIAIEGVPYNSSPPPKWNFRSYQKTDEEQATPTEEAPKQA